ncbi:hypothetical protein KQ939_00430 [Planococcus sp. CP5-4]|uniref:hypothetical protein n=1 Tax=unclassified Planococcus (in: firmicutes) TaxID=2662419 RepID=UPI001C21E27E|nr:MULTISPECIES: hypothetical protein [unclassified Planococcus (in: firmicutes)]MBU9673332.1 hypothetical protein [Planococcus sp. CP5-4_YE]MBV0908105.1 hypothetical protein [Planococcus sp. CP5-4_UN]MBW6062166.1 hypothetical protein [Planococcus sp. CP5-4]
MENQFLEEYKEYISKIGDRKALYKAVAAEYSIRTAIYPGSFIDISPSLVIPDVTYIDNFKGAIRFFKQMDGIKNYVEENKEYPDACKISFIGQDYTQPLEMEQVDLIISQYAGFVGQETKRYLKLGGILLCNDSHGDATLARFDQDFEFIGIVNGNNKIEQDNLERYFQLAKDKPVDLKIVKEKMKGLNYTVAAENYVFRKIS